MLIIRPSDCRQRVVVGQWSDWPRSTIVLVALSGRNAVGPHRPRVSQMIPPSEKLHPAPCEIYASGRDLCVAPINATNVSGIWCGEIENVSQFFRMKGNTNCKLDTSTEQTAWQSALSHDWHISLTLWVQLCCHLGNKYDTSVACLWASRESPTARINFTVGWAGGEVFHGGGNTWDTHGPHGPPTVAAAGHWWQQLPLCSCAQSASGRQLCVGNRQAKHLVCIIITT